MKKILELGDHYVSDFMKPGAEMRETKPWSLDLYLDQTIGAVRLDGVAPLDKMYGQYWYRSGTNATMTKLLGDVVAEVTSRTKTQSGDIWLDIACNDGTLLRQVPDYMTKVGIDPADDSFLAESTKHARVIQDFFTKDAWNRLGLGPDAKAKVITCIAMFYDLDNPRPFIRDAHDILTDDGVFVLQMSYTPLMLKQLAFDNICHEHVYYYDLNSIKKLFESEGFVLRDCTLNDANGGSFRVTFQKDTADEKTFATRQIRDVCEMRIAATLQYENAWWNITDEDLWKEFGDNIWNLKKQVLDFLHQAKAEGKKVYGYGASTKGNTLLQLFGITPDLVTAIAERSPYKFGLLTVGTNIPICSEEEMRAANPDYLLVLPWHFIDEFVKREQDFISKGGKLVVPCPTFQVIG
ncbi:methyltransferase domain-containing protein [bacterium]|nr:methyltransferase domain-containing protein [bacterium]